MPGRLLGLALAATLLLAGCGDDEDSGTASDAGLVPDASGTLRIAVDESIQTLDPLFAASRAERLGARQVHEPLIATQNGPFGQTRRRPGLLRSLESQAGGTIWTARLRGGIRFDDGAPLDADAVRANAERWMSLGPGPELVPELIDFDSPRPGRVRFFLDRPSPRFPRTLSRAELGIVTPDAIEAAGFGPVRLGLTGTGPFELREREADRTLFARNASWWGAPLGLGPGVDQLEFLTVPAAKLRADELVTGSVEVADQLDPPSARQVAADPLLVVLRGEGSIVGLRRSVRGIESVQDDQPLADVWLTDLR